MEQRNTGGRTATASFMMIVLALLAVAIPFSSNIKKTSTRKPPLVLRTESELGLLKGDRNSNQTADWKDLILETMSTTTKEKVTQAPVDPATLERVNDPNNLTSSFAKNIYTASAFVAKNSNTSEDDQINLVSGLVEKEASKIKTKVYTTSDIAFSKGDSSRDRATYGNALAILLQKADSYDLTSDDLAQLAEYSKTQDDNVLLFFTNKQANLRKILDGLLSTPVPPSAAVFHLNLINAVSLFSSTLDAFAGTKNDPIKSLAFLNSYEETTKDLFIKIADLQNYFILEKVSFTEKDPGYVLIRKK